MSIFYLFKFEHLTLIIHEKKKNCNVTRIHVIPSLHVDFNEVIVSYIDDVPIELIGHKTGSRSADVKLNVPFIHLGGAYNATCSVKRSNVN